ncbi:MAG: TolC family protein [Fimbriimonadaceae bacterium]|nr:TolC family protein [Fimbriimonadaceae bacterium]QYK55839.1 MAG: TolC family protein [Fimbriimonadaceae bacterium]
MIALVPFFLLWQVSLPQEGGPVLTLNDALSLAEQSSFALQIAQSRIDRAGDQVRAARGALGPAVSLSAAYSRFEGSVSSGGGFSNSGSSVSLDPQGRAQAAATPSVPNDSKTASVSLRQAFDLSGGTRKQVEALRFSRQAEIANYSADRNTLYDQVRRAYFQILQAEALTRVQQEALTAAQERQEKAEVREREGAIPNFDVLRFRNEVRKTEQALFQAQGNVVTAKQALNNLLARPVDTPFQTQPIDDLPEVPEDPEGLVRAAIQARPELEAAQFRIRSLDRLASATQASLQPDLALSATHTRVFDPAAGQDDNGTIGTLAFSWPVFDSGITRGRVDAAREDERQARIGLEQQALGVALETLGAHTRFLTAERTYTVALDSERLAREALRLAQLRYDEGAGILLDVIQAQADLTAAQGNVQQAKYNVLAEYSALLRALGRDALPNQKEQQPDSP